MKTLKDFLEKDIEARDAMLRRIKMQPLGCRKELLGKLEIIGDNLMDIAVEQNRIIQNLKKVFKQ